MLNIFQQKETLSKENPYLIDNSTPDGRHVSNDRANGNMISGVELSQSAAAWYAIPNPIWYTAPC
jgi:hypothetical protein